MKTLALITMLITTGAHAEQFYSNDECLKLYKTSLKDFEVSKSQSDSLMIHYSDMCMPKGSIDEQIANSRYRALLTAMSNDTEILALEARLIELGLEKPIK